MRAGIELERTREARSRARRILASAIELRQARVSCRVLRRQGREPLRVGERFGIAIIELRILSELRQVRWRARGIGVDQLFQHRARPAQVAARGAKALERDQRIYVAGRELEQAHQHLFRRPRQVASASARRRPRPHW